MKGCDLQSEQDSIPCRDVFALRLSGNKLARFSQDYFLQCSKLVTLAVVNSQLTEMPDIPVQSAHLSFLLLGNNYIKACGRLCERKFNKLENFDVSNNRVEDIFPFLDAAVKFWPKLRHLGLRRNPLRTIPNPASIYGTSVSCAGGMNE